MNVVASLFLFPYGSYPWMKLHYDWAIHLIFFYLYVRAKFEHSRPRDCRYIARGFFRVVHVLRSHVRMHPPLASPHPLAGEFQCVYQI